MLRNFVLVDICDFFVAYQVPEVVRTDYQLIDVSDDGFVSGFPYDPGKFFC